MADTWKDPRVIVDGDAEKGWIVDIHDGVNHGVYSPEASDAEAAKAEALALHAKAFPAA